MSITHQIAADWVDTGSEASARQARCSAATLCYLSTIMQWSPQPIRISSTARYWNG
jgi:hypothetical protein